MCLHLQPEPLSFQLMLVSLTLRVALLGGACPCVISPFPVGTVVLSDASKPSLFQAEPALAPQPELAGQCSSLTNSHQASPAPHQFVDVFPTRVSKQMRPDKSSLVPCWHRCWGIPRSLSGYYSVLSIAPYHNMTLVLPLEMFHDGGTICLDLASIT